MTVAEIARQELGSVNTLYNCRDTAKQQGMPVPGKKVSADDWAADAKLSVVIEMVEEKALAEKVALLVLRKSCIRPANSIGRRRFAGFAGWCTRLRRS